MMKNSQESSFFAKVRFYRHFKKELDIFLSNHPEKWVEFNDIFIAVFNSVSEDILRFEENKTEEGEITTYQLRKIFEKRYRKYFLEGDLITWCFKKPYGYAGDFRIIDDIYLNQPTTAGFSRLWDSFFQQEAASKATRERKEDFRRLIYDFVKLRQGKPLRIMNLACGPAREIKELLEKDGKLFSETTFDCLDNSVEALDYAKHLLNSPQNVNFMKKNAFRMALKKDINQEFPFKYDLIYSTGLFDYLSESVAVRLVSNLQKLLTKKGELLISNYREKNNNHSAYLMEWITEWNLVYRSKIEFEKVFLDAGFLKKQIQIKFQSSGVMQYASAKTN